MLRGKKIVIGITGSIAAYKIPFLVRLLVKEGAEVQIIMTPASIDFVTPLTLSTLSGKPVIIDPFKQSSGEWNSHIELGLWADLMLFAPVTANTLGKMVNGVADNFLITAYLSARCPVFIAPAMDMDMYGHPSTQKNISLLQSYGNIIIEPQVGELASGLSGPGRLEDPSVIVNLLDSFFDKQNSLAGKNVLVTAGPTHEAIDPVRYIGNHSSGKMGFAIAREAANRGAKVTLVSGPVELTAQAGSFERIDVENAGEMYTECMKHFPSADITIMAAAVADYTPAKTSGRKIKKQQETLSVELVPTKDILAEMGSLKRKDQVLIGFALETENEMENANLKLASKNLDMIVMNSLREKGAGFGTDTNKVVLINKSGKISAGSLKNKSEVASDILDAIGKLK